MNKYGTVRVGSRISKRANDWLDRRSLETSLSKSALINIAIENYIKENEVVYGIPDLIKALELGALDRKTD